MAGRYSYLQAFIVSPQLNLRIVEVRRISDGIAILEVLGEGRLLVSTRIRPPAGGYFNMAEASIQELQGKTEAEVFAMLDRRMDVVLERERNSETEPCLRNRRGDHD
jgi:hypothetical protein